jgi:Autotransporter beta-domain
MKQLLIFSAAVAVTLLGFGDPALADCAVEAADQTCTNSTFLSGGQFGLRDNGTTLTVTNTASGTISGGFAGISANINASVTNSGTIVGGSGNGVGADGNVAVTNSGTISGGFSGIGTDGTAAVTNSGTISGGVNGIGADGTAAVTNSGTISGGLTGISAPTANVTNSGAISATGAGSFGIDANIANVTNSGTISATGSNSIGIVAVIANVINSGTISATGAGSFGISADAANVTNSGTIKGETGIIAFSGATLINSGSIIGTGGTAIDFSNSGSDSLTFLPGSRIVGNILLGANDTVNIRTGRDVAWLLTFGANGSSGLVGTGASVNVSGGAPFVISGNQVATLDPTAFGLADRSLMNVTGGISSLVAARFGGMAPVGSSAGISSFAPAADKATEAFNSIPSLAIAYAPETPAFKAPPFAGAGITTVWTGAFGGVRHQSADGAMLGATDSAFGAALGVDRQVAPDLKLGGFVGGGAGRLAVDLNSQSVDTGYIFGGAYGRFDWASQFADFMLYGGRTSSNSSRTVANNLAPNGLETATARYDGFFISPDIAYGWRLPVGSGYMLTPTARLRYVAGFFDGFAETGSAQNLSVGSRTIQDFEQRFELDLTRTMTVGASDTLKAGLHVGAIGLERVGDTTVNTVLLGQNLAFVTPGKANAFGGLAGTSFDFASHQHISVFGALEGIWMNDRSTTVTAKAGLRGAF